MNNFVLLAREKNDIENAVTGITITVQKSTIQLTLEANGCVFRGESMDKHEKDTSKICFCGRPWETGEFVLSR